MDFSLSFSLVSFAAWISWLIEEADEEKQLLCIEIVLSLLSQPSDIVDVATVPVTIEVGLQVAVGDVVCEEAGVGGIIVVVFGKKMAGV